ncbi:MAG: hypothetical protein WBK37_09250 [Kiritimatiellia bacterium]|nr:MAG: hypothetical protein BWX54_01401 [Verrucomicrobia bacterium ADurb.Bin018]
MNLSYQLRCVRQTLLLGVFCNMLQNSSMAENQGLLAPGDAPTPRAEALNMLQGELTIYGIPLTQEGLTVGLQHKERAARVAASRALGILGNLDTVGSLGKLATNDDQLVSGAALRAINTILHREVKPLAEALYRQAANQQDRFDMALLLCTLGDPSYFQEVLQVIRMPVDSLFVQAVRNVPDFAKYVLYDEGKPVDWVQELASALNNPSADSVKRIEVIVTLKKIGSKEAIDTIRRRLSLEKDASVLSVMQGIVGSM